MGTHTRKEKNMKRIVMVVLACVALTACVKADDVRTLDNRVYEQKLRVDELQGKVDQLTSVEPQKADTWSQVQSMRQELAELRSELDSLGRDVETLHTQVESGKAVAEDVKDLKIGWQRLNSQMGTDVDLVAIRAERMPVPASPLTQDAAANATKLDGSAAVSAVAVGTGTAPVASAAASVAPAVQPKQPAPAVNADAASTLYKSARAAFEARDYRQGIALWDEFVSTFDGHKLVPNALFWQGECYYQMKDYARAVLKYQVVIDKYKKSTKYPTSLLKQGISFMRLGRIKAGKLLLKDVADSFPKTPEGRRAATIIKQVK